MELSTFGAILKFVMAWEDKCYDYYQNAAQIFPILTDFATKASKRRKILERGRREWVTEMILEPIAGVNRSDYEINWPESGSRDPLEVAIEIENTSQRLYSDMADCIPLPEVARVFKKFAREHNQNIQNLGN